MNASLLESKMSYLSFSGWLQACLLWGWSAERCARYPGQSAGADKPPMGQCMSTHSGPKGNVAQPAAA